VDKKRGKTVTKEAVEIRQRLALDQHRREQDPIEQNRLRLKKLREAGFLTPTRTKLSSEHLCVKKGPAPLPWVSSCGGAGQSPARVHLRHAGFLSGYKSTLHHHVKRPINDRPDHRAGSLLGRAGKLASIQTKK